MWTKKAFFYLTFLLLGVSNAQAKLLLEPYLGYHKGTFELESGIGTNESDVDGVALGARIGWAGKGFFIGPDLMMVFTGDFSPSLSDPNLGPSNTALSRGGDANYGTVGITAGYKIPVLPLRVYGGVNFFASYSLDFTDGSDTDFEGKGYKIGVGYKPGFLLIRLPFYLNIEYVVSEFDSATGVGTIGGDEADFPFITGSGSNITQYNDATVDSLNLTLSIPFTFFGSD